MTIKKAAARAGAVLLSYWTIFNIYTVVFAPISYAKPTNPLCDSSGAYRQANPLICDTGGAAPGTFPGGGGGGSGGGGLLGLIGHLLGGLL